MSSGIKLCCSLITSKSVEKWLIKYDLLFFVGNKDKSGKSKLLSLESAKIFFGSGPQLCYQLWLLHAILYGKYKYYYHQYASDYRQTEPSVTQYLSIISSIILMTKSAFELLSYQRSQNTEEDEDKRTKEKIMEVLKLLLSYLSWLPLILTSLLYKVGSINLYMRFFGWASFGMFIGIFLLNILSSLLVPAITNSRMKLKYPKSRSVPDGTDKSLLEKIYLSYTNLFVITRPLDTFSSRSMNTAILIQPVQCLVNIIFIPVYLSFSDDQAPATYSTPSGFQIIWLDLAVVILILTLVNIILCFTNVGCKIRCLPSAVQSSVRKQMSNESKKEGPEKFTSVELDDMEGDL